MNWPWQQKPEPAAQVPVVPPLPPIDVAAIARQAATAAAEQARAETLAEVERMISSSPMPGTGAINPDDKPLYPLYAWDNPWWYSLAQAPTRRPGSLVSIQTLRQLADTYDVLRSCINHIKDEVFAVPLEIVPRNSKDQSAATKAAIVTANAWFGKKGGLAGPYKNRRHFESELIEDLAVIGNSAVYHEPTRGGRTIASSVNIDAATIRPVVDAYGWAPDEPYEQWILGMRIRSFRPEEMTYDGLFPKSYSPYFWSPVEWLIYTINRALRSDRWNEAWLTDGTTPSDIMAMPDNWTPDQVKSFQLYWDAMLSGDSKARQGTKFVPSGTEKVGNQNRKDQDFQAYELWLLRRTCAIMSVHPASIGFVGEQYAVTQEQSMDATSQFGVGKYLTFRKDFYDDELERIGFPELEAKNVTSKEDSAGERATRNTTLVAGGVLTPNEARSDEGLEPIDGGDTLFLQNTLVPLEVALIPPPDPLEMVKATAQAKAAGNGPNNPTSDSSGGSSGSSGSANSSRVALAQWEKKALNRFRAKRSAAVPFESEDIARAIHGHIESRLAGCTSPEAVRSLFREAAALGVEEAQELTAWSERVARELEALSEAGG